MNVAGSEEGIVICRCEDVTLGDIRRAIMEGATTMDEIRRVTRAGMGPCQGRTCRPLIASELGRQLKKPVGEVIPSTFRPPVKAVKMGDLAAMLPHGQDDSNGSSRGGQGGPAEEEEPSC